MELGWYTGILHLAPNTAAGGKTVCRWASPGCIAACLNTAGRGRMKMVQNARVRRTQQWHTDPKGFLSDLQWDIKATRRAAKREGLRPAIRLNGTSDIPWEKFVPMSDNEDIQFYDYTKSVNRMYKFISGDNWPSNYHLTFSLNEKNAEKALAVLKEGGNIAAVMLTNIGSWRGYPTVSGDIHDLTFTHPPRTVLALKPKGRATKDITGFVITEQENQ